MPEGHTLHRMALDHAAWFAGREVEVSSANGRFSDAARLLTGTVLETTEAYGKHLFHAYEGARIVHVHLGLFGKVFHASFTERFDEPSSADDPADATPDDAEARSADAFAPRPTSRYRVVGPRDAIDLVGATACDLYTPEDKDALLARLGPDPLRDDADPDKAFAALQRRSVGIGRALMDQAVLAGIGNVYRAEVLFVHGVHPTLPARQLARETWDALWSTLVRWLHLGVKEQRIITVDPDEIGVPRSKIRREDATYVYKQDRCRRCGTEIRRWDLAGRWAYACETCQPPPR